MTDETTAPQPTDDRPAWMPTEQEIDDLFAKRIASENSMASYYGDQIVEAERRKAERQHAARSLADARDEMKRMVRGEPAPAAPQY